MDERSQAHGLQSAQSANISERKAEHVRYALVSPNPASGASWWDDIDLIHEPLPEFDAANFDPRVQFLGREIGLPLLISSMTGGHPDAEHINRQLGALAERNNIPIGLGSMRAMIVDPRLMRSYAVVREYAPSAFVLGNIGAPQLVPQGRKPALLVREIRTALDHVGASALIVHLNFAQESVQPGGDLNAAGVIEAIDRLVGTIGLPVIVKETGAGLSARSAQRLSDIGVVALDVGGSGGTSMTWIEGQRAAARGDTLLATLGATFASWGNPTPAAVRMVRRSGPTVIASGGIRNGLDAAKAIALGANLTGMARPFLEAAVAGDEALATVVDCFRHELSVAAFLTGSPDIESLRQAPFVAHGRTRTWIDAADRLAAIG